MASAGTWPSTTYDASPSAVATVATWHEPRSAGIPRLSETARTLATSCVSTRNPSRSMYSDHIEQHPQVGLL